MTWLKYMFFVMYSLATVVFIYYLDVTYFFHYYKDWLFCDFKNASRFDYIVVGAGSAGSVIAAKLSKAGASVLLIEAGGAPSYFFNIPIMAPMLLKSPYDWNYATVPQENSCKGLKNNQSIWPAGKILGGSSRLNYMVYVKGHENDYDSWFSDYQEPIIENGGSLYVDDQRWYSPLTEAILEGIREMSLPLRNINKKSSTGFMRASLTSKHGERWSTDRLLHSNEHKRLRIMTHSFVTQILFKSNKAIGIKFQRYKNMFKAFSKKGVILSAGAIGSPKILMLSGIGPKQHLEDLKIKLLVDLPVGQHLMDHIITGLDLVTLNTNIGLSIADILNPYSALKYYLFGTGPWTSAGVDVIGTFHSKFQSNKTSAPDLQIMVLPLGISQDNGLLLKKKLGIPKTVFSEYFSPLAYKSAITIAPVLLHPKSFGEIRLRSSDPFDAPIIDPKYLSNEEDLYTLIDGINFVKKLLKTEAMRKIGAQIYEKSFPGCENFTFDTSAYWKCYLRHLTLTTYHPGGTCGMGSVVDSNFRVYKTKNLYVVDASVFPKLPSGNTHAPVVMLSEKAVKLLIKDFNKGNIKIKKCYKIDILLLFNKNF